MTRAESILASRLLDAAAEKFHEHGCNDMDPEFFEDLTEEDLRELEAGYNAWVHGETGETCGSPDEKYVGLHYIGDDMWMAYLSAVVGRKDSSLARILDLLDRIQPYLRHIPDVTHTEIEELRGALHEVTA